jgi:hypothetical protein
MAWILWPSVIQGDSGGKVDVLGGDSIGHCEEKLYMNTCLVLNCYRDTAVWISRSNTIRLLFVGLNGERSLVKERWIHETNFAEMVDLWGVCLISYCALSFVVWSSLYFYTGRFESLLCSGRQVLVVILTHLLSFSLKCVVTFVTSFPLT